MPVIGAMAIIRMMALACIFATSGRATDLYYMPTPVLGSAETTENVEVLTLINELGLNPLLPSDPTSIPERAWCLSVAIGVKPTDPKHNSYLITLFEKGGPIHAKLEYGGLDPSQLRAAVKCLIATFMSPH